MSRRGDAALGGRWRDRSDAGAQRVQAEADRLLRLSRVTTRFAAPLVAGALAGPSGSAVRQRPHDSRTQLILRHEEDGPWDDTRSERAASSGTDGRPG